MEAMEFEGFPKMGRLFRDCVITEKIDGTCSQVAISETGEIRAASRTRWITPEDDNFGFAAWVRDHAEELITLGPGRHFGEWWGGKIQRGYGIKEKRWSLFNVSRWCLYGTTPQPLPKSPDPKAEQRFQDTLPPCCGLVPVLYRGAFDTYTVETVMEELRTRGSMAAPGFMDPEGVVVFHTAANVGFKATLKNDGVPKSCVKGDR